MSRVFLTDWESPGKWSKARRSRACDAASISNQWTTNPFGIKPVETFVAVQPGVLRYEGRPADTPLDRILGSFGADSWLRAPDGELVFLWTTPLQDVLTFNLTKPSVRQAISELWVGMYPWASGLYLGYYSTYVGRDTGKFPSAFWTLWQEAWLDLVARIRRLRPDWKLIGEEWQATAITPALDRQFFERHPQHFGRTMAEHDRKTPRNPGNVWEIRTGWDVPDEEARNGVTLLQWQNYVRTCLAWIESRGEMVSFGRDSTAGKGLPA